MNARVTADGKTYGYSFSRALSDLFLVDGVPRAAYAKCRSCFTRGHTFSCDATPYPFSESARAGLAVLLCAPNFHRITSCWPTIRDVWSAAVSQAENASDRFLFCTMQRAEPICFTERLVTRPTPTARDAGMAGMAGVSSFITPRSCPSARTSAVLLFAGYWKPGRCRKSSCGRLCLRLFALPDGLRCRHRNRDRVRLRPDGFAARQV